MRLIYLLVATASVFIIILGIQSAAYVINSILLAAMITIAVLPIPKRLIARGWSAAMALVATLVVVVGVLGLILFLTWTSIGHISTAIANSGTEEAATTQTTESAKSGWQLLRSFQGAGSDESATQVLKMVVSVAGGFIAQAITVLMILIFMLSAVVTTPLSGQLEMVKDAPGLERLYDLTNEVQKYISITTLINALVGLVNTILLWIVGVEFAVLWGILAWIAGYIPVIGYWIALIPPVLLAWAQFGLPTAIFVFLAYAVINGSAENLIKPRMMGEGLDISPLIVFVSLVFWGWVLGGAGAILAVPLTLVVFGILESFEATRWIVALGRMGPAEKGDRQAAFQRLHKLWGGVVHSLRGGDDNDADDNGDDRNDEGDGDLEQSATAA